MRARWSSCLRCRCCGWRGTATRIPACELTLDLGPCRFYLTHGNRHLVKSGLRQLVERGIQVGAKVVLYGHTHRPAVQVEAGVLCVNPGTLKQGFPKSYAILTITGSEVQAEIFGL